MAIDNQHFEKCNNFWYEFDKALNPPMPPKTDLKKKVGTIVGTRSVYRPFLDNFDWQTQTLNSEKFKADIISLEIKDIMTEIANVQLKLLIECLGDKQSIQKAFEYFGQGILYDGQHDMERTALSGETGKLEVFRVHMADNIGVFGIWHAFIRASDIIGIMDNNWLGLDKMVGLAYLIHSQIGPLQSFLFPGGPDPKNAPMKQRPEWPGITAVTDQCLSWIQVETLEEMDRILAHSFNGPFPF